MKVTNKFYLMQVGQDIVSNFWFRYDLHTTDICELKIWCGFDSVESLYKSAKINGFHLYKILKVNTISNIEEVY